MSIKRFRLFWRIWFKYYDDLIMYDRKYAKKEWKARMWVFDNITPK